ncbi:MAG: hypothetical protein JO348_03540 [Alphaproteobacteria bacterium]|nr:hypothetical protein [Alphaproteobacteria bacterium]
MSDTALARDESALKVTFLIAYGLFALAAMNGLTAIAGIVLVYLKRDEARGTLWESHARNLQWVFWASVAVAVIGLVALGFGLGGLLFEMAHTDGNPREPYLIGLVWRFAAAHVALLGFAIWYIYRVLRGFIRGIESKPY